MMRYMSVSDVTHFARVDFRNKQRQFGIKDNDRFSHVYVIGKTGTGKSSLLETMTLQDIRRGGGVALIDPHGDLVERIAHQIPDWRKRDVVYLNASDPTQPFGYNPLRHVREDRISLAASGFLEVFKKMWPDAWGVRMEHILRNVLLAILEQPNATMRDIQRMFSDKAFRTEMAKTLKNAAVKNSSRRSSINTRLAIERMASRQFKTRSAPFLQTHSSTAFSRLQNQRSMSERSWMRA